MQLPKRLNPDKTTFINVDSAVFPISVLPENIANEFTVLDKMKFDIAQLTYDVEVLGLAIQSKTHQLNVAVKNYLDSKKKTQDTPEQEDKNAGTATDNVV